MCESERSQSDLSIRDTPVARHGARVGLGSTGEVVNMVKLI